MKTLEVQVRGPGLGPRIGAAGAAGGRLHDHLDPRRDADPAQRLPAAQAAPRLIGGTRPRLARSAAGAHRRLRASIRSSVAFDFAHACRMRGKLRDPEELAGPDQAAASSTFSPGGGPDREATIVVEPLERGFGITLGNALRRVLLSSLQGAAITAVQIDGVLHEFSTIAGVREDVTDIVLNLKALGLRAAQRHAQAHAPQGRGPGDRHRRDDRGRPRHRDHGSRPRHLPRRQGRQARRSR